MRNGPAAEQARDVLVAEATCLGCACVCDDVEIAVEHGRIVEARRACLQGAAWFEAGQGGAEIEPSIEGAPAGLGQAIERAVAWLGEARAPIVVGLEWATIEAQRVATAIADQIGAAVSSGGFESSGGGWHAAHARVGAVGATLGEIRDRADVVVFDGRNPPAALPRFAERFLDPPGRLVPDGRAGRTVIWLGDADAETITRAVGAAPDLIMRIDRPAGFAALRAILRGAEITEGVETEALRNLAARLQAARYGVLVLGGPPGDGPGEVEEALKLVRDLNRSTRFVAIHPAASGENTPGAAMVTAWQAGVATALDLALGYPRQLPGEGAAYRIARREIDAVLDLKGVDEIAALGAIRTIRVGRDAAPGVCSVAIPTGRPGIEEDGTVARFDGVMLPLRAPLASSTRRLRQVDVLEAILDGLRSARGASR